MNTATGYTGTAKGTLAFTLPNIETANVPDFGDLNGVVSKFAIMGSKNIENPYALGSFYAALQSAWGIYVASAGKVVTHG